ncbi:YafY family protein [Streptomyces sp. JV185]|uniref:helix-turn-helix transcriptional regulator n=1 Tax=Streptomyces sp. JV185 TaxID=858638 RepID=UPI002E76B331|nr:YafY family protein [Streptomyces sp. JV185]MEE1767068.1 YafY family protein [Streptomyces sp. JV185]
MSDTPARLLKLLSVLQGGREHTGPELAERLGISPRTVRRDIDRLRELGYPVEATIGAIGGYRLVAGMAMPPLLLEDDEAVAVAVGLRAAASDSVSGIPEASARALAKLEQVLPDRLRRRVRAVRRATVPLTVGPTGGIPAAHGEVDADTLAVLAAASTREEGLRFRYRGKRDAPGPRHVEPYRLVSTGGRWYLVAYDRDRDDWRSFRVDRITEPHPTGVRHPARELPAEDAAAFVAEGIAGPRARYRAVVTLYVPLEEAARRLPRGAGRLEPDPESAERCTLIAGGDALDWLAVRIALLGMDFEVREPAELVEFLDELGQRITRRGRRPPPPPRG